jgi:acetyl/propionyl-CoA carboxylase alpha subunit
MLLSGFGQAVHPGHHGLSLSDAFAEWSRSSAVVFIVSSRTIGKGLAGSLSGAQTPALGADATRSAYPSLARAHVERRRVR